MLIRPGDAPDNNLTVQTDNNDNENLMRKQGNYSSAAGLAPALAILWSKSECEQELSSLLR